MRKLPVYILVDVSDDMIGEPILAIENRIQMLVNAFRGDPQNMEFVYVSIISFGSSAQQIVPLTDLISFQEPSLKAGGDRALGAALELLCQKTDEEVRFPTNELKGDWKPVIFIMICGSPTDNIIKGANELRKKSVEIVCGAVGFDPPTNVLHQISDNVVQLSSTSSSDIAAFFKI